MNYFTVFALLATLATACSAFPTVNSKQYDLKCYTLPVKSREPIYEIPVFRDCLVKEPCNADELCCPKVTGGGKCVKNVEFQTAKFPVRYDSRCFRFPFINYNQNEVEKQEIRDCLNKDKCADDEICCPSFVGSGGRCAKKFEFEDIPMKAVEKVEEPKQYDINCYTLPIYKPVKSGEPIYEIPVFRDCLNQQPCSADEVCCPKSLFGLGGQCIKTVEFQNAKREKFDARCFAFQLIEDDTENELESKNCLADPCKKDEICCPKMNGSGKCVKLPILA